MNTTRNKRVEIVYNGITVNQMLDAYLEKFSYVDSVDESDTISLVVIDRELKWVNSWIPQTGDIIMPTIVLENWNYSGEKMAFMCGSFVVDDFNFEGRPVKGNINGVSAPVNSSFKESENTKTWEEATLQLIAGEIAARYGLVLVYDVRKEVWISKTEQSQQTDGDFIKRLCGKYGLGIKVYANRLVIWDYLDYFRKPPVMTITPDQVSGWKYKSTMQGTYTGARVSYTNPGSGQTVNVLVGTEERLYKTTQKAENEADARLIGEGAILSANRKRATMQLTLPPKLSLAATNTVMLDGFGKMDGKYFIEKTTHNITKKAYGMQVSLSRIDGKAKGVDQRGRAEKKLAEITGGTPEEPTDSDTEW